MSHHTEEEGEAPLRSGDNDPEYSLTLMDSRRGPRLWGHPLRAEDLAKDGDHFLANYVPASEGKLYSGERVYGTLYFPQNLTRDELAEVFRWLGSLGTPSEIDRVFECWQEQRLIRAGVRIERAPIKPEQYSLESLWMLDIAEGVEALRREVAGEALHIVKAEGKGAHASKPRHVPRPRRRSLGGRPLRYGIVKKKAHAELHFRSAHGTGPVKAVAKIDLADVDLAAQHAWHLTGEGSGLLIESDVVIADNAHVHIYLHRLLCPVPDGEMVGFKNGDRLDLRRENLAPGLRMRKAKATSKSGVRGVSWNAKRGKWEATVGKRYLGSFATVEEAGAVAKAERDRLGWLDLPVADPRPAA